MTLEQPYLIQRGQIKNSESFYRLSEVVKLDYMGSSEFEFGALPQSFKDMHSKKDSLKIHTVNSIRKNHKQPLLVYGSLSNDELKQYVEWLTKIRNNDRSIHLKERARFNVDETTIDFWWDITNGIMFSFNDNFMRSLPTYIKNSWQYMKLPV